MADRVKYYLGKVLEHVADRDAFLSGVVFPHDLFMGEGCIADLKAQAAKTTLKRRRTIRKQPGEREWTLAGYDSFGHYFLKNGIPTDVRPCRACPWLMSQRMKDAARRETGLAMLWTPPEKPGACEGRALEDAWQPVERAFEELRAKAPAVRLVQLADDLASSAIDWDALLPDRPPGWGRMTLPFQAGSALVGSVCTAGKPPARLESAFWSSAECSRFVLFALAREFGAVDWEPYVPFLIVQRPLRVFQESWRDGVAVYFRLARALRSDENEVARFADLFEALALGELGRARKLEKAFGRTW